MHTPEKFTVLVADDSPIYRKLVERALSNGPYSVLFACNGRDAIEMFARHSPSLVITDWEMPNVTGIELCQHIRRSFPTAYTYIIILTAMTDMDKVVSGLDAGADDYLTKPFHARELLARLGVGRRIVTLHRQIETKNRQLEELALTDPLTELPNRRAVDMWITPQLEGAARHCFPLWVVMADIDRFKSVNDTYGHDAGDTVLKKFAQILKANTRRSNLCGRIGGEEFILVLTHVEQKGAGIAIERVRKQLESEVFTFESFNLGVTASFGVANFQGTDPSFGPLAKRADLALYSAKRNGRNRVEFHAG